MTGSNVASWSPLVPNPHPSVIEALAEAFLLHGRDGFDAKAHALRIDRAAAVKLTNEYLEEHGPAGPIRRITA